VLFDIVKDSLVISMVTEMFGKYQEQTAANCKLGDINMDDSDNCNQETSA